MELQKKFCDYAYSILMVKYTFDEISSIVRKITTETPNRIDFATDDWDEIIKDIIEDVVGICLECGNVIYKDNLDGCDYNSGKILYECPECGYILKL